MTLSTREPDNSLDLGSEPTGGAMVSALGEVSRPPVDALIADGPIERLLPSISARILKAQPKELDEVVRDCLRQVLEVLHLDYITHARAKGLSELSVMLRHAFKSSFGPTWTLLGLILGNLLAGVAVIETVFTIPGLGRLLVDAIFARDYPVIQGCLLFIASVYVLVNLLVDLLYPIFDPRVAAQ